MGVALATHDLAAGQVLGLKAIANQMWSKLLRVQNRGINTCYHAMLWVPCILDFGVFLQLNYFFLQVLCSKFRLVQVTSVPSVQYQSSTTHVQFSSVFRPFFVHYVQVSTAIGCRCRPWPAIQLHRPLPYYMLQRLLWFVMR